jgi:hypothetical protein
LLRRAIWASSLSAGQNPARYETILLSALRRRIPDRPYPSRLLATHLPTGVMLAIAHEQIPVIMSDGGIFANQPTNYDKTPGSGILRRPTRKTPSRLVDGVAV